MSSWIPRLDTVRGPKYLAVADALAADIRSGHLKPGDRLPPQRLLARALGFDLTTVTRAYNEVRRLGLIEGRVGQGSFVREAAAPLIRASEAGIAPVVDMTMNMPPQPANARLEERIRDGLNRVLSSPDARLRLHYQDSAGALPDRLAGARWLEGRLGVVPVERLLVAGGAQSALHAILATLLQPGDALITGTLTYPGLRAIAERRQIRLVPVEADGDGLDPMALDAALKRERPRALYCVPTFDNPTTATLPEERRRAIVASARRHGVAIIEDDAYGALVPAGPPSFAVLAPEITWHVATLSKCATPALRVAYVIAPDPRGALQVAATLRTTSFMAAPLMTALVSQWVEDGTLDDLITSIREENVERQRIVRQTIKGVAVVASPQAPHVWLRLPTPWRRADFVAQARHLGLALVPSDAFAVTASPPEAARLSLGAVGTRAELERALRILAGLLTERPAGSIVV